jgi:hypothetical protein
MLAQVNGGSSVRAGIKLARSFGLAIAALIPPCAVLFSVDSNLADAFETEDVLFNAVCFFAILSFEIYAYEARPCFDLSDLVGMLLIRSNIYAVRPIDKERQCGTLSREKRQGDNPC